MKFKAVDFGTLKVKGGVWQSLNRGAITVFFWATV